MSSTVVLCTTLSLTSACHVIHDITERKKSIPKAHYGKTNPADGGEESEEVPGQRNVSSCDLFELHACATFTSIERHHVGATPPRLYSPRLLIVRCLKSGTAKTIPAIPAVPALQAVVYK